jgi:hypothetical protein
MQSPPCSHRAAAAPLPPKMGRWAREGHRGCRLRGPIARGQVCTWRPLRRTWTTIDVCLSSRTACRSRAAMAQSHHHEVRLGPPDYLADVQYNPTTIVFIHFPPLIFMVPHDQTPRVQGRSPAPTLETTALPLNRAPSSVLGLLGRRRLKEGGLALLVLGCLRPARVVAYRAARSQAAPAAEVEVELQTRLVLLALAAALRHARAWLMSVRVGGERAAQGHTHARTHAQMHTQGPHAHAPSFSRPSSTQRPSSCGST